MFASSTLIQRRPSTALLSLLISVSLTSSAFGLQKPTVSAPALQPAGQHDRVSASANFGTRIQLRNHVPSWARAERQIGKNVDLSGRLDVTVTLQRDPAVQAAFEKLLADQQDPSSAQYHQWLTPAQVGELYGPTQNDVDAVTKWLSSQGYAVRSVSASRMQVHVTGTYATASNAFHTSFAYFQLSQAQHISAVSEPFIPAAITPIVRGITGLSEVLSEPQSHATPAPADAQAAANGLLSSHRSGGSTLPIGIGVDVTPQYSSGSLHYVFPADFNTIYDLPSGNTGATIGSVAQHIAIIGRSRVSVNDAAGGAGIAGFSSYKLNQIAVPASAGGVDPGISTGGDRSEATLDVARTITTANGATTDLVVSASTNGTDGVVLAAEYEVNTLVDPIMSISFGGCESYTTPSYINMLDALFSQAAAEGISTFVSSGDSAAAGCDTAFAAPPATQFASPNFLCASSYVTCVGGTEFADSNYSAYWSTTNSSVYGSALGYIPEGSWNEPGTTGTYQVAGTGGGVSSVITKPTWQTGTGVPADGYRDTPDVAFTAANHDGYYICYTSPANGCAGYLFSGTSAAAPGMAAIAALLNTKIGMSQGNLNPLLYRLAASSPAAFHDVTVASSGVSNCAVGTPSMCNNSTVGGASSLTGGLSGYLVTTGYDQATGLGSLDVSQFLTAAAALEVNMRIISLTIRTGNTGYITTYLTYGGTTAPTGAVTFLVNGSSANLSNQTCVVKATHINCTVTYSAVGVTPGNYLLSVSQAADSNYVAARATGFVTVTAAPAPPAVVVAPPVAVVPVAVVPVAGAPGTRLIASPAAVSRLTVTQ